jgi:hypothetical protein
VAVTTSEGGSALTGDQIAQLERWARTLAAKEGDESLRRGALAVVTLAGEVRRLRLEEDGDGWEWADPDDPGAGIGDEELHELIRAGEAVGAAPTPEHQAVARAVAMLAREVDGRPAGEWTASIPGALPVSPSRARFAQALVLGAVVPALVLVLVAIGLWAMAPDLDGAGPADGTLLGSADIEELELSVAGADAEAVRWSVDGEDVTAQARVSDGRSILAPAGLADGGHEVEARTGGSLLWNSAAATWELELDGTPPSLELPGDLLQAQARTPFVLAGAANGATTLVADERDVEVGPDGRFEITFPAPPTEPIDLVARDAAGNTATRAVSVVLLPRLPSNPVRAVHVSADAWANAELRAAVLKLLDEKRINAVELDLKDELGIIGWDAPVPLGREIGAVRDIYDLEEAVELLHAKGARVIGRLVAFRDPIHAEAAWRAGRKREVVQTPAGRPYSADYGGFTNFADPAVRQYNIDVAVAAARLGVDDILYDYVRRPDGPLDTMRFPGLEGDAADSIVTFLAETRKALEPTGAFLGASVFGVAVNRPDDVAQDIGAMARELDYVAPMLYPSHWGPGEYGLDNPNNEPYEIVRRSLEDFKTAVDGTGARLAPWLQDFSLGVDYGPAEVKAQIKAARDAGVRDFLLWDPAVTYTARGLAATARFPSTGEKPPRTGAVPLLAPNELGVVPVLMYHQLLPDGGGEFDLTPAEFQRELQRLWRDGYRPARASDLLDGTFDVPRGTTPVVLTFDDSSPSQAALAPSGELDPDTMAGILVEFAKTHPGFEPAGTFYVNAEPFTVGEETADLLATLVAAGFELANHTSDHHPLGTLAPDAAQQQLVLGNRIIHEYLPDAEIRTMALPHGSVPEPPDLALEGSWDGESYRFDGVMLVGAEPAPSPYSAAFVPDGIPRVRSTPDRSVENGSADWLDRLSRNPELRFVSDGDPVRITVAAGSESQVAEQFRERVTVGSQG